MSHPNADLIRGGYGSLNVDIVDLLADDAYVAVIVTEHAEPDGKSLGVDGVHLCTVANGHATTFVGFNSDQYGEDEFYA